ESKYRYRSGIVHSPGVKINEDEDLNAQLDEDLAAHHMRAVAHEISQIHDETTRKHVADHFARVFADLNPRFSHDRFHAAASGNPLTKRDAPTYKSGIG